VRCPKDCNILDLKEVNIDDKTNMKTSVSVLGLGIHPLDTPICPAGIVDNAMPVSGGVMNISIAPGFRD